MVRGVFSSLFAPEGHDDVLNSLLFTPKAGMVKGYSADAFKQFFPDAVVAPCKPGEPLRPTAFTEMPPPGHAGRGGALKYSVSNNSSPQRRYRGDTWETGMFLSDSRAAMNPDGKNEDTVPVDDGGFYKDEEHGCGAKKVFISKNSWMTKDGDDDRFEGSSMIPFMEDVAKHLCDTKGLSLYLDWRDPAMAKFKVSEGDKQALDLMAKFEENSSSVDDFNWNDWSHEALEDVKEMLRKRVRQTIDSNPDGFLFVNTSTGPFCGAEVEAAGDHKHDMGSHLLFKGQEPPQEVGVPRAYTDPNLEAFKKVVDETLEQGGIVERVVDRGEDDALLKSNPSKRLSGPAAKPMETIPEVPEVPADLP